jgi:hypothetical protein
MESIMSHGPQYVSKIRSVTVIPALFTVFELLHASGAGADDRKQLAFEVIERNAQQMTDISDSLYYFGELGMQEFESTNFQRSAGMPVVGLQTRVTPLGGRPQAASSNDDGDVSWVVPAGSLAKARGSEGSGWRSPGVVTLR